MIVPMTKATIISRDSAETEFVENLKEFGLLHIESKTVSSDRLLTLIAESQELNRALDLCPKNPRATGALPASGPEALIEEAKKLAARIIRAHERLRTLRENGIELKTEAARLAPWGEFDSELLKTLTNLGFVLRFYALTREEIRLLPPDVDYVVIARSRRLLRIVVRGDVSERIPDSKEFRMPERSLSEVRTEMHSNEIEIRELDASLSTLGGSRYLLVAARDILAEQIEVAQVSGGLERNGSLVFTSGYLPRDAASKLRKTAAQNGWALLLTDPVDGDPVPTITRNPAWISIIRPVFGLIGTVPGYFERDISFWFLGFLTLFFAMLYGDGGYGTVFLFGSVAAIAWRRRRGMARSELLNMLAVFSAATVIWGAITGTWFGVEAISKVPPFSRLTVPALASFDPGSTETVKFICFALAVLQIGIAHVWNFIRSIRGPYPLTAFAQIGWLAIVLGAYNLVLNLVIDPTKYPLLPLALYGILGGIVLVLVFTHQRGDFLKGLSAGFAVSNIFPTLLNSIGVFSDLVSYIRLFAVGLASASIAVSFNAMAASVAHGAAGVAGAIVILLFGHLLNITLGSLAVIVHGVRLNLLEFSANHLGIEWKGIEYKPFARTAHSSSGAATER